MNEERMAALEQMMQEMVKEMAALKDENTALKRLNKKLEGERSAAANDIEVIDEVPLIRPSALEMDENSIGEVGAYVNNKGSNKDSDRPKDLYYSKAAQAGERTNRGVWTEDYEEYAEAAEDYAAEAADEKHSQQGLSQQGLSQQGLSQQGQLFVPPSEVLSVPTGAKEQGSGGADGQTFANIFGKIKPDTISIKITSDEQLFPIIEECLRYVVAIDGLIYIRVSRIYYPLEPSIILESLLANSKEEDKDKIPALSDKRSKIIVDHIQSRTRMVKAAVETGICDKDGNWVLDCFGWRPWKEGDICRYSIKCNYSEVPSVVKNKLMRRIVDVVGEPQMILFKGLLHDLIAPKKHFYLWFDEAGTGNNGKSTLVNFLGRVFGNDFMRATTFKKNKNFNEEISGRRSIIMEEITKEAWKNEEFVSDLKKWCGDVMISISAKYRDTYEEQGIRIPICVQNGVPEWSELSDLALFNRVVPLVFEPKGNELRYDDIYLGMKEGTADYVLAMAQIIGESVKEIHQLSGVQRVLKTNEDGDVVDDGEDVENKFEVMRKESLGYKILQDEVNGRRMNATNLKKILERKEEWEEYCYDKEEMCVREIFEAVLDIVPTATGLKKLGIGAKDFGIIDDSIRESLDMIYSKSILKRNGKIYYGIGSRSDQKKDRIWRDKVVEYGGAADDELFSEAEDG